MNCAFLLLQQFSQHGFGRWPNHLLSYFKKYKEQIKFLCEIKVCESACVHYIQAVDIYLCFSHFV